ncbi:MAG: type II toxin-antitoxin system VapC family toxin [Treponema sp.]|nr:type II toxin-antitoxin system VapC family toxin [Treponema sp.]
MNNSVGYLLDTHTFLWSFLNTSELSQKVRDILESNEHPVYVSTISFWEVAIKEQLGKYSLNGINSLLLPNIAKNYDFEILNPDAYDFITYKELPVQKKHKDPFDRMLIHLAIRKNLVMLSRDSLFPLYEQDGLQLMW